MAERFVQPSRRAFSLVELLVVSAILGISIAVIVPAVQTAREAARRLQCANNVKQLGLGLHHFHDSHQFLPPGGVDPVRPPSAVHLRFQIPSVSVEHGWAVFVLPFVEQQSLHDQYRFGEDWRGPTNRTVRETRLSVWTCPSAPERLRMDKSTSGGFSDWQAACSDYGVCNEIDHGHLFNLGLIDATTYRNARGMMRINSLDRFSDVRDGLSNTSWLCEDAGRPVRHAVKQSRTGRCSGGGWADRENAYTLHGFDRAALRSGGECALNCTNDNEIYSFHPGGAMIGLGDGSVRFLAEATELRVVAHLLTCAAGEVTGDS